MMLIRENGKEMNVGSLGPYEHLKIYNSLNSLGWQIHQTGLTGQCSHELLRHAISIGRTVTYSTLLTVICIPTTVTMKKLKTRSSILMGGPSGMVSGLAGNTCPWFQCFLFVVVVIEEKRQKHLVRTTELPFRWATQLLPPSPLRRFLKSFNGLLYWGYSRHQ